MEVTESSLASALERFYVTVESGGWDGRGNLLTVRGPVADPDETTEALFATLARMAALREPPSCPWCRGAPFVRTADCTCVISCGREHCCPDGTVVDAHICCEHADDTELSVMACIVRLMEAGTPDGHAVIRALYPLDGPALVRVLRWLLARFPADPPS